MDHVMACVFNVFYVLNLGLSYEEEYEGPAHGKASPSEKPRSWGNMGYEA
jgi:hypothetical protein